MLLANHSHRHPAQITKEHGQKTRFLSQEIACCQTSTKTPLVSDTTKVRCFNGSTIADLHDYLKPLIKKKPEKIILMVGTNDLMNLSAAEMTKSIKSLSDWILSSIPDCNIIVSEIVRREDKKFLKVQIFKMYQTQLN